MDKRTVKTEALVLITVFLLSGFITTLSTTGGETVEWTDLEENSVIKVEGGIDQYNTSYVYRFPERDEVIDLNLSISPSPYEIGTDNYPSNVWFNISGIKYFKFPYRNEEQGYYFGDWGHQTIDVSGSESRRLTTSDPITSSVKIALPKNASVTSSTVDVEGLQRSEDWLSYHYTNTTTEEGVGYSITPLGDLNQDGREEVIVSSPWDTNNRGSVFKLELDQNLNVRKIFPKITSNNSLAQFGFDISRPIQITGEDTMVAVSEPRAGTSTNGVIYLINVENMNVFDTASGNDTNEFFGTSVESCDINGDGESEIIVGAPNGSSAPGEVYVLSPDPGNGDFSDDMDLITVINGTPTETRFGKKIACGRFNSDSYEDVVVASDQKIRIYLGSDSPDPVPDYTLEPLTDGSVTEFSYMEILENTGTGTLAVGCPGGISEKVLLYDGVDTGTVTLTQTITKPASITTSNFGESISRVCDYDLDGNPEFAVGASGTDTSGGAVAIYELDDRNPEKIFYNNATGSRYGHDVAFCADMKGNSYKDLVVGAPARYDGLTTGFSRVFVEEFYDSGKLPENRPTLLINGDEAWTHDSGHLRSKVTTDDLSVFLNTAIDSADPIQELTTPYNEYVIIDLTLESLFSNIPEEKTNQFILSGIDITYDHEYVIGNISERIMNYVNRPNVNPDEDGTYHIPTVFHSDTKGAIEISNLDEMLDSPPSIANVPDDLSLPEDTHIIDLVDIWEVFEDDRTSDRDMDYNVFAPGPNASYANISIFENRYLSVDLKNDTRTRSNDNWTGEIEITLVAKDVRGHNSFLPDLKINVTPVNDAPVLTNRPAQSVQEDESFVFTPVIQDAEGHSVNVSLEGPENMTLGENNTVRWLATNWDVGINNWTLELYDGDKRNVYDFSMEVINLNDDPYFVRVPPKYNHVYLESTFYFNFKAVDIDPGDEITYKIIKGDQGSDIDPDTGNFSYSPPILKNEPMEFLVRVRDSQDNSTEYTFYINITLNLLPPELISSPETQLKDMVEWNYTVRVFDPNEETPLISVERMPEGMEYNDVTNELTWTPSIDQVGEFEVWVRIRSSGYLINHTFNLTVSRSVRSWHLNVTGFEDGEKVKDDITLAGNVSVEPSEVLSVQIRIDAGEWINVSLVGNTWSQKLDTTRYENGDLNIEIRAWDGYEYSSVNEITLRVENEKESSPLLTILIIIACLILIPGSAGLFIYFMNKRSKKKEEEEEKKRRMEELKSSKDDLDSYLKEVGADNIPDEVGSEEVQPMDLGDLIGKEGEKASSDLDHVFDTESETSQGSQPPGETVSTPDEDQGPQPPGDMESEPQDGTEIPEDPGVVPAARSPPGPPREPAIEKKGE